MSIDPKYLARFSVVLNEAQSVPVAVAYATEDGTALQDVDYEHDAGELVFQPGETELYVSVPTRDFDASATSFKLQLTSPVNATVVRATGVALFPTGAGRQIVFRDTFSTPSENIDNRIPEVGKGYTPESIAVVEDGVAKAYHPDGYSSSLALVGSFRGASRDDGSISLKFRLDSYVSTPGAIGENTYFFLSEAHHRHHLEIGLYPGTGIVHFNPTSNGFADRAVFIKEIDGSAADVEFRWNFTDGTIGLYLNGAWKHSYQYEAPRDKLAEFTISSQASAFVDNLTVSMSGETAPADVWAPENDPLAWYAVNSWADVWNGVSQYVDLHEGMPSNRFAARVTGAPAGAVTWVGVWDGANPEDPGPVPTWPDAPDAIDGADNTGVAPYGLTLSQPDNGGVDGEYRLYAFVDGVQVAGYLWMTWLQPYPGGGDGYRARAWGYADGVEDEHGEAPELIVSSPLFWYARGADGVDNATPTLETGAEESTYWNTHVAYGRLRATVTGDITWRTEWVPAVVGAQAPTSHWPIAPYTVNGADNTANFTRTIKAGFPTWERDSIGEFRAYCSVDGVEIPGYLWLTWLPPVQGSTYNQHAWGYSDEIG